MVKKRKDFWYWFLVILVLVLAADVRFWHLQERRLIEWDESYYFGVAKTYRVGFDWFVEKLIYGETKQTLKDTLLDKGIAYSTTAKPGFIFFVFLFSFIFGTEPYLILLVSAISGLATVYLVGYISNKTFGKKESILSMLLLSLSFIHVYYSRSGNTVSVSSLFLFLGLFFYFISLSENRLKYAFLSGLMIGYSFTAHYNLFWVPVAFFVIFLYESIIKKNLLIKKYLFFYVGALIPIIFFEIYSKILYNFVAQNNSLIDSLRGGSFFTYFEELLMQRRGFNLNFSTFYLELITNWEGTIILVLFLVSLIWFLFKQNKKTPIEQFSVVILSLLPFLIFSLFSYPVARNIGIIAPFASMIIAGFILNVFKLIEKINKNLSNNLFSLILIIITISGFWNIQPILDMKSGIPEAIKFMETQGSTKHLTTEFPTSRVYVGRKNAMETRYPFAEKNTEEVLKSFYSEGYKFILLGGNRFTFLDKNLSLMLQKSIPIFTTQNSFKLTAYESLSDLIKESILSSPDTIEVYSIKNMIENNKKDQ